MLGLSIRQTRRLVKKYKLGGSRALIHKSRGRVSNNKLSQDKLDLVVKLIKEKYWDFGPTLAHEKLVENHGFNVSLTTLRNQMIKVGLWQPSKKRKAQVHQLRERRTCFGELVQLDGSPHDWFERNGISSINEGNKFLSKFTRKFSKKFSVSPKSGVNMHRRLEKNIDLTKVLCIKESRVLSRNLSFQHNNTVFQIQTKRSAYALRNTLVTVCERYDETITIIKKLPSTKETSSKQLNYLVDGILKRQTKKNPWESSEEELAEYAGFYTPMTTIQ